jgi:hypothetical protein
MHEPIKIRKKVRVKHKAGTKAPASRGRWHPVLMVISVAAGILLGVYILFRYMD